MILEIYDAGAECKSCTFYSEAAKTMKQQNPKIEFARIDGAAHGLEPSNFGLPGGYPAYVWYKNEAWIPYGG